ncbi:hypothetical protein Tco_0936298 [Tanacetum coccineum]
MATTIIRIVTTGGYDKLQLSPWPMADATKFEENKDIVAFATDPDRDLETITIVHLILEGLTHSTRWIMEKVDVGCADDDSY